MMTKENLKMKDSGIVWIGQLPKTWEVRRLKYLSNIKRGASPRPIDDPKYFDENGEFAWVRISDVTASKIYLKKTDQQLSELGASLSVKQYCGDLFLSIAGTVGKPIISGIKCCIHDGFVAFSRLSNKVNKMFLFYILDSGNAYSGLGKEGSQLNLNIDTVANISIPLPSIETQNAIANYLDEKTAQIGKFVDDKKKMIGLLKEQKQAIIHQATTKGIDKNAKMKDSGVAWLGQIPENWIIAPLSKYFVSKVDYRGKTPEKVAASDYFLVTTRNIKEGVINYLDSIEYISKEAFEDSRSRGLPRLGDIIFTMEAPLGEVAIVDREDVAFGQRIIKFRLDQRYFLPQFTIYSLRSNFFQFLCSCEATGSTALGLKSSKIHKLKFILPPIEIQSTIVAHIEKELSRIDTAIKKIEQEIELAQEYKKSLIFHTVTGKITIN